MPGKPASHKTASGSVTSLSWLKCSCSMGCNK
ncbi:hypothetical protein OIU77_014828 [Salix suchowensis]|uniref:Uncharacterized protein n=1 Tax=Salix suchowensis TaxID=1278906 RepID=A0ABQ8ZZG6_9ROSI|nr:hypothetical protein OIU77_014828 [Salix suchowensis]KAJ6356067.1 hypothetical protein OIU78_004226 [Salix suchowensis]